MSSPIPRPSYPIASRCTYDVRPRPERMFHTPLDAHELFAPSGARSTVTLTEQPDRWILAFEHPLKAGTIRESLTLVPGGGGVVSEQLERDVLDAAGRTVRKESVDFRTSTLPLPQASYPEVMLPFVLAWQPHDGVQRTLYAWINDRFVARVQVQSGKRVTLDLPIGRREAITALMWPDLNDWIPLGRVLTRMVYPFVPKYRMWFAPSPPYRVLRYEGPYGPPGSPEVVLELAEEG